jgi:hypothetical protein
MEREKVFNFIPSILSKTCHSFIESNKNYQNRMDQGGNELIQCEQDKIDEIQIHDSS